MSLRALQLLPRRPRTTRRHPDTHAAPTPRHPRQADTRTTCGWLAPSCPVTHVANSTLWRQLPTYGLRRFQLAPNSVIEVSIPTPHLEAAADEIAEIVLLPGDPLRAQFIAENFLDAPICYNRVRNMLGFTGTYKGVRISVQGTGMGMPSISIYTTELMRFYGVKTAIRIGSCGAILPSVKLGDVIIALSAHTTSNMNRRYFHDIDYAATASYDLVRAAADTAAASGIAHHVGPVLTGDAFYHDDDDDGGIFDLLGKHGTLAVEMECAALYTIAAREGARALGMVTVSDHLLNHEVMSSEERQTGLVSMVRLALDTAIAPAR